MFELFCCCTERVGKLRAECAAWVVHSTPPATNTEIQCASQKEVYAARQVTTFLTLLVSG